MRILVVGATGMVGKAGGLGDVFPGHETVRGSRVAKAHVKSVEDRQTGQTYSAL